MQKVNDWFAIHGWRSFEFQQEAWKAYLAGESGLVHAPTGMGKTFSVWLGPVLEWLSENPDREKWPQESEPLRVLWITPLRALATDTMESLLMPVRELGIPWTVEKRTGDTSSSAKAKQKEKMPTALVTTPESLSLFLTYHEARKKLSTVRCVVVDEWHELMGTKRGVQTELCLARLRTWNPALRVWGISATLGNLEQARDVLLGPTFERAKARLVRGHDEKQIDVVTLRPESMERFPWGGHLGLKLLPQVIDAIGGAQSTLLFTNTRSQAELWFKALAEAAPQWVNEIAIHHGSIDREIRDIVEQHLSAGNLRCVVCTASLDLGVDFSPVDQVIQVGSPKGIARLLQRAGRSGHQPGATSRILCVPTNAFELVEFSAARDVAAARRIESRDPLELCLDVLVQHVVTLALGEGFRTEEAFEEVRTTFAYQNLTREQWQWVLDFVSRGGPALARYPQFSRIGEKDGVWKPVSESTGRMHRLGIGTITSDASVTVKTRNGGMLGSVEESFVARMKPGTRFLFAGKALELVRFKDLVAHVKVVPNASASVPKWMGGRMPLSTLLADAVEGKLNDARQGIYNDAEMRCVSPILELQKATSIIPKPDELLIEQIKSKEGYHAFVYTYAGRLANEGTMALVVARMMGEMPLSFSTMANDYGFELFSSKKIHFTEEQWLRYLSPDRLLEDLLECMNSTELARRQFREIARIAGLIFSGYPGSGRSAKQLQVSSGLLYDVFRQFDPGNLLLDQARREILERQLEVTRLRETLEKISRRHIVVANPERLTPFAFPLWAERFRQSFSSEKWQDRLNSMIKSLEENDTDAPMEKAAKRVKSRKGAEKAATA